MIIWYNKYIMQKENLLHPLQDADYLLKDQFTYNGLNTQLYLYEKCCVFNQDSQLKFIKFDQATIFQIYYSNEKCLGIKFFNPEEQVFVRNDWVNANVWENILIKKIRQKNFHQYYRPIKKIGKGNFASVYLAHNKKQDTLVAVKAFVKDLAFKNNGKRALQNQVCLLRKLQNSHILTLLGVHQTSNSLYIVTQYIQGVSLQQYLKHNKGKLNYQQRKNIIRMILKALAEMERNKVLHRDLKPENIMISKDAKVLKIVDFGLATHTNLDKYIFVRCGTPGYVAPEILRIKDDQKPILTTISDMFSLGSIFYQMIFEKRLFDAHDHQDVLNQNRACIIKFNQQMKNSLCFDEADLLQKMLAINPKQRISASQALQHAYIAQRTVNIFGSMRHRISKPVYMKSRKQITSLDKSVRPFNRSLNK